MDDLNQLQEAFSENTVTWVDVQGLGDQKLLESMGEMFGLHALMLEDIVNVPQRAKVEAYDQQLLMIIKMVDSNPASLIEFEQVSIVLSGHFVITFQERYGDVLDPVRRRIRNTSGQLRKNGADYLAYAIADTIIDAYYHVLEVIGERLEVLEDEVIQRPTPELLQELNRTRNRLTNLRRGMRPQREALNQIIRGDFAFLSDNVRMYFRDTYDHCVQTTEVVEMYREMMSGLMNTYLSAVANRTNDVMKVLTIVSTIFIPLTFLAGIYGMNFEHMPELHFRWGYPLVWFAMLGTSGLMVWYFRQLGWLGSREPREGTPE